jgi:hypothetical protein
MSDNKIDRNEYDMLYPSEKEFKTWVQNQELNEVRAELKRRLIASLNESTRKNVKEIFSPFNTINS